MCDGEITKGEGVVKGEGEGKRNLTTNYFVEKQYSWRPSEFGNHDVNLDGINAKTKKIGLNGIIRLKMVTRLIFLD